MTSNDIKEILETRHKNNGDIFIAECKVGGTWNSGFENKCYRLDGWAMKKSWTNPTVWGYEIKVNRNDFLNDDKWQNYLPYCTDFYFVCPKGIIKPEELQENVGLLTVHGTRLYTAKKAIRRNVNIPNDLYRYIMMNRVLIKKEYDDNFKDTHRVEFYKQQLALIKEGKEVGWQLSSAIKNMADKEISKTREQNDILKEENKKLLDVKSFLDKNGIDISGYSYGLIQQVQSKLGGITEQQFKHIEQCIECIKDSADCIKNIVSPIDKT